MGWYEERVLPHLVDRTLGTRAMAPLRRRAMEGLSGTVLELGFGSGTNVEHYPAEVERVLAVEPSATARRISAKRLAASDTPVETVGLDGAALELADESVDNALSTWTLCTIPDVESALREVRRVLRPGGRLFYLEHGLSDDERVARRQRRWNGVQQRIAGGCHMDRPIDELLRNAGFAFERSATFRIAGPATLSFMYAGVAGPA
jgi:ubiquinone/menaquinone biosynthesis C-methylase UbiE